LAREQRAAAEVVEEMKAREFCVDVEKYDPVLKAHCRID
jgi:hypothetical protein